MLRRPLCLTPRLARQHLARNCYAIGFPLPYHVQWRRAGSSKTSTDSIKAPRSYKRYSAEDDRIILQMRALKHDWNSITSFLPGRNMSSVRARFYMVLNFADVGKRRRKATPEEIATMRDMLTKGFYIKAIAEKVGRSYKSTYDYCSSIKAEMQSPRPTLEPSTADTKHTNTRKLWTRAEIDRLLSLHAAGLKIDAVARELGRPTGAVRQKYRSHLPYRYQPSQFVTEGSGSDSTTTQRPRFRKAWSAEDDKHLVELVANGKDFERIGKDFELIGKDFERIASVLGRTATAVKNRWYQVVRPRLDYGRQIGNLSDASGTQKQDQQIVHDLPHIDP